MLVISRVWMEVESKEGTGYIHCAVAVSDEYELSRFQFVASAKASWM